MSNVSAALHAALEDLDWSQTELAARADIDRTMLNRYVRGTGPLGADNLTPLLRTLPSPHDAALLAAYLRDLIPSDKAGLVSILCDSIAREDPPELPAGLDPDLRKDIIFLAQKAQVHTEIKDLIMHFAKVLRS